MPSRDGSKARPTTCSASRRARSTPPRDPRVDRGRVGNVGKQPPREVLYTHAQGPRSAPPRDGDVDALCVRRLRRARGPTTADMTRTPAWRRYLRFWRPNITGDVDDELR